MQRVTASPRAASARTPRSTSIRYRLVHAAVVAALAAPAMAQNADDATAPTQEVTITGSRITTASGFTAPTPVSVVDADRIEQRAVTNVGDLLNELPSFRGTQTPAAQGLSGGYVGGRVLDLRGLGTVRTLVLVDSKRITPSTPQGTVDTNMIPSSLIERIDVVTGGASAAYGSDAVAGVVNFILNENLTGLKSSISYGEAEEGDSQTTAASLAGGVPFWGDRGHWVGAVEYERNTGVGTCTERAWCAAEVLNFGRPAGIPNTQMPANNILPGVRPSTISPTGVINSFTNPADPTKTVATGGPVGITFNPDGTPRKFQYGSLVNSLFMVGGEGQGQDGYFEGIPIQSPTKRYNFFSRAKAELTDNITGRFDLGYGYLEGMHAGAEYRSIGATILNIHRDNPFLPTSSDPTLDLPTLMDAQGIQTFQMGRNYADIGNPPLDSVNKLWQAFLSVDGTIGSSSWKWDAHYGYGRNHFNLTIPNSVITARAQKAADAVRNTAGQIVCRVNSDANPANDDPACVPMNVFGNQISQAAIDYITGVSIQDNITTENSLAANVNGELFNTWAGPVSLAIGAEWRDDKMKGDADPLSQQLAFFTNNAQKIAGDIKVREGYLETAIPLARDLSFAKSFDLNGAVRRTHYDRDGAGTSSGVDATTWKYGLVYQPLEWLRFRGTKSRDIRAPNVSELFGPVTAGFGILNDPAKGGAQTNPTVQSGSNANLVPEVADTRTGGMVITPTLDNWLGRVQFSIDYYKIEIDDAIGTLGAQTIATRCFQGAQEFCALITRDAAGFITNIVDVQQNVNQLNTSGLDIELGYRQPTEHFGEFTFRLLDTRVFHLITIDSAGPLDRAGQTGLRGGTLPGIPNYTLDALVNWKTGPLDLSVHGRYIPEGIYNAAFIGPEQSGYAITLPNSSNTNAMPSRTYVDLVGQYTFSMANGSDNLVVFLGVNNLTNAENPRFPGANGSGNNVLFDPIGRTYKIGFRFKQ
ncbi:MAG TPA: TonB-dependent receptor [Steroidobacteraceae bacterium]|nr:TonB-dependent receptor [Steroidobacteraceae bacterium]